MAMEPSQINSSYDAMEYDQQQQQYENKYSYSYNQGQVMDPNQISSGYEAQQYNSQKSLAGGYMTIGEMTIGVSAAGAQEYYHALKTDAIDKAIEALRNTDRLFGAINDGWQGQAAQNFKKNFDKGVDSTIFALDSIRDNIESLIARLVEQWAEEDKNMVDVYE